MDIDRKDEGMDFTEGKKYVITLDQPFRDFAPDHEFLVNFRGASKTGLLRFGIAYWNKAWGSGVISTKPEGITSARELPLANYADTALVSRVAADTGLSPRTTETTRIRGYHHVFGDFQVDAGNDAWFIALTSKRGQATRGAVIETLRGFGFTVAESGPNLRVTV